MTEQPPAVDPDQASPGTDSGRLIGDALVSMIDDFSVGDYLASITPDSLGEQLGYSSSSVRYQLKQVRAARGDELEGAWRFDRELLFDVMLDALFARLLDASRASLALVVDAIRSADEPAGITLVAAALVSDIQAFSPGATAADVGGGAERARMLVLTAAEGSPVLSRKLREFYYAWVAVYEPFYEVLLDVVEREPKPGMSIADLANPISMFLQGLGDRRRFEPDFDRMAILRSFLAITFVWTTPRGGRPDETVDEFLRRKLPTPAAGGAAEAVVD